MWGKGRVCSLLAHRHQHADSSALCVRSCFHGCPFSFVHKTGGIMSCTLSALLVRVATGERRETGVGIHGSPCTVSTNSRVRLRSCYGGEICSAPPEGKQYSVRLYDWSEGPLGFGFLVVPSILHTTSLSKAASVSSCGRDPDFTPRPRWSGAPSRHVAHHTFLLSVRTAGGACATSGIPFRHHVVVTRWCPSATAFQNWSHLFG